jgi:drug/metabolite transporter (DMT)-like permease
MLGLGLGATLISFSAVFVRLAQVGPVTAGFYRVLFGGAFLLLFALFKGYLTRITLRSLVLGGACGVVFSLNLTMWHKSIHLVGPGLATVLSNFQVFFMALAGIVFFSEQLTWKFFAAIVLAVSGLFFLVGPGWASLGSGWRMGVVFGLLAAMLYATYLLSVRYLQTEQTFGSVVVNMAVLSLITAMIMGMELRAVGESFLIPNLPSLLSLAGYGFFSQMVGWILISTSITRLPVSVAGLLILLQPSLAFVWDMLFFQRPTSIMDGLGALMAFAAIYLGATRQKVGHGRSR